ncbi:hypothetical protein ACT9ST_19975 [Sphingobium limneticum]
MGRKPQNSANLVAFLHIIDTSRLLSALRNDKRCIFTAARQAQDAADWLLSRMGAETSASLEEVA